MRSREPPAPPAACARQRRSCAMSGSLGESLLASPSDAARPSGGAASASLLDAIEQAAATQAALRAKNKRARLQLLCAMGFCFVFMVRRGWRARARALARAEKGLLAAAAPHAARPSPLPSRPRAGGRGRRRLHCQLAGDHDRVRAGACERERRALLCRFSCATRSRCPSAQRRAPAVRRGVVCDFALCSVAGGAQADVYRDVWLPPH